MRGRTDKIKHNVGSRTDESCLVDVRVTTKKMKFEARKLKFCTWGLEGRPDPKIEKKISKNFTPTQNAKF